VRVSQLNGCAFCVDLNSSVLLKRGVDNSKLEALINWKESPLFDESEKVVLEFAEAMTLSNLKVDDDLMERLKAIFKEDGIIELTAIISFQNMSTKFNTALGIPPQGFCVLP
jgi:AhpD family alkylhydroperoxidase